MSSSSALELLQGAAQSGVLGNQSVMALQGINIGSQIQQGLGIGVDNVQASEVFLLAVMPDDSGSIRFAGNTQAVRDGVNLVFDALGSSKSSDEILALDRLLNGTVIHPFVPLKDVVRLDTKNYNPNMGTPLYDETVVLLGTVLAKAQEFENAGVPVRTVTVIISDGADEHSRIQTAASVKHVVKDMLRQENHLVFFVGIDDAPKECWHCKHDLRSIPTSVHICPNCQTPFNRTNFRQIASEMGIPPEFVLTPGNSPSEIRAAMAVVSQSAVRASQGGVGFSQAASSGLGGFGA